MGGMIAAIEKGFPQMEIADSAYKFQRQLEAKEKIIYGEKIMYKNEVVGRVARVWIE